MYRCPPCTPVPGSHVATRPGLPLSIRFRPPPSSLIPGSRVHPPSRAPPWLPVTGAPVPDRPRLTHGPPFRAHPLLPIPSSLMAPRPALPRAPRTGITRGPPSRAAPSPPFPGSAVSLGSGVARAPPLPGSAMVTVRSSDVGPRPAGFPVAFRSGLPRAPRPRARGIPRPPQHVSGVSVATRSGFARDPPSRGITHGPPSRAHPWHPVPSSPVAHASRGLPLRFPPPAPPWPLLPVHRVALRPAGSPLVPRPGILHRTPIHGSSAALPPVLRRGSPPRASPWPLLPG